MAVLEGIVAEAVVHDLRDRNRHAGPVALLQVEIPSALQAESFHIVNLTLLTDLQFALLFLRHQVVEDGVTHQALFQGVAFQAALHTILTSGAVHPHYGPNDWGL